MRMKAEQREHVSSAYCMYMVSNSHRQEQIELIKSKQMCRKQASHQITKRTHIDMNESMRDGQCHKRT